ncbi:MAG: histidinol dehydrogenase [Treponema sp.]|jgi:histidinol dehydrogenase|nr:histidinol dehydrogenase [Treponema sp.]
MQIIQAGEFDRYWNSLQRNGEDRELLAQVRDIIEAVRREGDAALRRYAAQFDRSSPETLEVPPAEAEAAWRELTDADPELAAALELAADHIRSFAELQKAQFTDFEYQIAPGVFTGQRVIPVERAAVYAPGGRFPLISTALMGLIPAMTAGVEETALASPPGEDGLPHRRILAAAHLAGRGGRPPRIFAAGGAQAVAALALGTASIPRCDVIAGPGNKYVAAAKRLLYGEAGIDFVAGPTDVLVITGGNSLTERAAGLASANLASANFAAANLTAADLLAQAEHDPDACARALVPDTLSAERILEALEDQRKRLPDGKTASASLERGGIIIVYQTREEAIRIANAIAPEHLELHTGDAGDWVPALRNYGSLFIGSAAAEVLGDYTAGINHTLPTSGSARFTGGLSVRHFLKTATTLRCTAGEGYDAALAAAEAIARAEGLAGHAASAASRRRRP